MVPIHQPVLLKEAVDFLKVSAGKRYVDATLGQAGHSLEVVRRGGQVLGIEINRETYVWVRQYLESLKDEKVKDNLKVVEGSFADLERIASRHGFAKVDGVLFDLGLSYFLLEKVGRGFSYLRDEPLDMRFDPASQETTAADLVNGLGQDKLYEIFTKFGEERSADRISHALVRGRRLKKIKTTLDLVSLVESAYQRKELGRHLARIFQALRIAVNGELENLRVALPQALEILKDGGRLCVISFHSLEDRIVKKMFGSWVAQKLGKVLTPRPVRASLGERMSNPASAGGKLRVFISLDYDEKEAA